MLKRITAFDCPMADKAIQSEYGYLARISAIYPKLDGKYLPLVIFQIGLNIGVLAVNGLLMICTASVSLSDIAVFSETLHFLVLIVIGLSVYGQLLVNRPNASRLHASIGRKFYDYGDLREETDALEREYRKNKKVWLVFWPLYMLCCVAFLIVLSPLAQHYYSNQEDLGATTGLVNRKLPISYWTPYDSTSGFPFYGTLILELTAGIVCALVLSNANILYIAISQNIIWQLAVLKMSIGKLQQRALVMMAREEEIFDYTFAEDEETMYSDERFMKWYQFCFRQNIEHHNIILKVFSEFVGLCHWIVFTAFLTGSAMIAAAGVSIMSNEGRIWPMITVALFCSGEILNMFILCWFGEQIYQMSIDIRMEVYSTNWYLCSPSIKRSVTIIQEATKIPLVFRAGNMVDAKLETFSNIMNASYSYFNLLFAFNK